MFKKFLVACGCFFSFFLHGTESVNSIEATPTYLYKILSIDDWEKSQHMENIKLPITDHDFIHLSTDKQLENIIKKYWCNIPQFVVLTIDTNKLVGNLLLEANPGGSTKYYHLYDGSIPLNSVVDYKVINQ